MIGLNISKQAQWNARLARAEEVSKLLQERYRSQQHFVHVFANLPASPDAAIDGPRAVV